MINLRDFLKPQTEDELFDLFLGLLAAANFPVTSWQAGGVARTLVRLVARGLVKVSEVVRLIALGGFNSYSSGDWLSQLSFEVYDNTRTPATFASGQVQLGLSSALAGPYTITGGQFWFAWNGKRYRNTSGTPLGSPLTFPGTVTLSLKAESPGAKYNAPDNQLQLQTPLPGLVVLASTITVQGTDPETDPSLQARNAGKWGTLGPAANEDGWETHARDASPEVTRVRVLENTPEPGEVRVVVAGAGGALAGPTLDAVNAYLDGKRPFCVLVEAVNATEQLVPVIGSVTILSSHPNAPNALAQAQDAINALFAALSIGGIVRLGDQYAAIEAIPGIDYSLLSDPPGDVQLDALAVGVPVLSLTPSYT